MLEDEKHHTVLIINGNIPVTRFLSIKLKNAGYEVDVVHTVEEAEASISKSKPDVLALAAPDVAESKSIVSRLHKALKCPILMYGIGLHTKEEKESTQAEHWIGQIAEPGDFVKAIEMAITKRPNGSD